MQPYIRLFCQFDIRLLNLQRVLFSVYFSEFIKKPLRHRENPRVRSTIVSARSFPGTKVCVIYDESSERFLDVCG